MTLLAILISYFALRESWVPGFIQQRAWALGYIRSFDSHSWAEKLYPILTLLLFLLGPVLLAWLLAVPFEPLAIQIANAIVAIVLLCSTLRSRRLNSEFQPFITRWQKQEWQAAFRYGARLFQYRRVISKLDLLNQTMTCYWVRMNQSLFAPLFWFLIFDTPGLIAYALVLSIAYEVQVAPDRAEKPRWKQLTHECLAAFEGLSARFVVITMGMALMKRKLIAIAFRTYRVADYEPQIVLQMAIKEGFDFAPIPADSEVIAVEGGKRLRRMQELSRQLFGFWLLLIGAATLLRYGV